MSKFKEGDEIVSNSSFAKGAGLHYWVGTGGFDNLVNIGTEEAPDFWYDWKFDFAPKPEQANSLQAKKDTSGKVRMDILFRLPGLKDIARVFTFGEEKYPTVDGDFNWRKGKGNLEYKMKLMAATLRHMFAYMTGEKIDPEHGQPHLAHAACNLLMVADIEILEAK